MKLLSKKKIGHGRLNILLLAMVLLLSGVAQGKSQCLDVIKTANPRLLGIEFLELYLTTGLRPFLLYQRISERQEAAEEGVLSSRERSLSDYGRGWSEFELEGRAVIVSSNVNGQVRSTGEDPVVYRRFVHGVLTSIKATPEMQGGAYGPSGPVIIVVESLSGNQRIELTVDIADISEY